MSLKEKAFSEQSMQFDSIDPKQFKQVFMHL